MARSVIKYRDPIDQYFSVRYISQIDNYLLDLARVATQSDVDNPRRIDPPTKEIRYTNWQAEMRYQSKELDKRQKSATVVALRIEAEEAYLRYAKARGLSQQYIDVVIKDIRSRKL